MRRFFCVLLAALLALLPACAGDTAPSSASSPASAPAPVDTGRGAVESDEIQFQQPAGNITKATLHTSRGDIVLILYPDYAPLAVENFLGLAREGYYDGTAFHRSVPGFVIQGGDGGGGGKSIWGTPFLSEFTDELHHYAGALCMAGGDGKRDTHLSQFYIVAAPAGGLDEAALARMLEAGMREEVVDAYRQAGGLPYLDYGDTVFGQVYAGMEVVDAIAEAASAEAGTPQNSVVIESVEVEGPQFS